MGNMIGKPAPEWSTTVYDNGEKRVMSSEELAGKWYVIYWYPLDFTFICPTEIVGFEELKEDFEDDGIIEYADRLQALAAEQRRHGREKRSAIGKAAGAGRLRRSAHLHVGRSAHSPALRAQQSTPVRSTVLARSSEEVQRAGA